MFYNMPEIITTYLKQIILIWTNTLKDLSTLLVSTDAESATVWNVMREISNSFSAIGATVLIICFLIGVIGSSGTLLDTRRPEHVVKLFFRFLLARFAITQAPNIMLTIFNWSKEIAGTAAKAGLTFTETMSIPEEVETACEGISYLQSILIITLCLIGMLVVIVLSIMIILTVYGRIFKIYIYTAISPIPLASFGSISTSRVGKSFLRSYIGICMEAVMMILVCIVFINIFNDQNGISFHIFSSGGEDAMSIIRDWLIKVIFYELLLFTMIKGTDRIVREMMGG